MIPEAVPRDGRQTNGHHFRGCGDEPHPCDRAVCGCLWHRCEIRSARSSGQPLGGPADRAGLLPGDTITKVNGASVSTFKDVDVSAAMAKPDEALLLEWTRDGRVQEASVLPEVGPRGLLSLGILPAASATLRSDLDDVMSQKLWSAAGLASVPPGSVLTHLDGEPVSSFSQAADRAVSTKSPRLRFSTPEGGVVEVPWGPHRCSFARRGWSRTWLGWAVSGASN